MRQLSRVLILLLVVVGSTSRSNAEEAAPDPLSVLQRFVGEWETETHIRHVGPPVREIDTRGKATCQRTLEGQYFEFRSETVPPGDADLQIMTYDAEAGLYRQWVFSSDGYRHEATGSWDPKTSILRWTGKSGNASFVILDHWASPDRLEWTLLRTDAQGQRSQTIQGTVTRSKPTGS